MKHKILYIPEGKYLKLGWHRSSILEDVIDGNQLRNTKTGMYAITPEQAVEAIITWRKDDTFFSTNGISYPVIKSEFEIVEIPD